MPRRTGRLLPYAVAALTLGALLVLPSHEPVPSNVAHASTAAQTVRMATIHFAPEEGKVANNRAKMVELTTNAASKGAKLIVLPEMATSGYSFFSRDEISKVAEELSGPTTAALSAVARQYKAYIAFGMPVFEPKTNLYYNSAVLLDPQGQVKGTYRKRNHLLESSYNADSFDRIPTFDTEYGRMGLVICSDMFNSQFPRAAAVAGANILIAPANVGIETDFVRVRAYENDTTMIVSNRYGKGTAGTKPEVFTQNTFTIPSPFPYDFNFGSRSVIMTHDGNPVVDISGQNEEVGVADVLVPRKRTFPVERKPAMYSLLAQDTLAPYTRSQFRQPAPATFAAAAVDPGAGTAPWTAALTAARKAKQDATAAGKKLRLIVFPANYLPGRDASGLAALSAFATSEGTDLLIHFPATGADAPVSTLLTSDGKTYDYKRTHKKRGEPITGLSNDYLVIDRDYGRLALMQDVDMLAPETAQVLARMGVDVVAMNADGTEPVRSGMWKSRTGDYLHIVTANKSGPEGIYLGGYRADPPFTETEGQVIRDVTTGDVREKPSARFFDATQLLEPCQAATQSC
ncbi:nitrilase-related carbon-nitrogen hydrolase [Amycolatopsis anabasis]|uniref:nitrilase-related carbon-nitrogen hydrolase n=1 Tax=Amycolatopsis anabasis TaxID=1840409 RepID=UPI00131BACF5|nr:nitrilase-related carbon-nitrogen hydrolase [Amycolatopsis anabasis]